MHNTLVSNQADTLTTAFHTTESHGSPEQGVAFDPQGAVFFVTTLFGEIQAARPSTLPDTLQALCDAWYSDALDFSEDAEPWLLLLANALPQTPNRTAPQGALELVGYDYNTRSATRAAMAIDEAGNAFIATVKRGQIVNGGTPEPMSPGAAVRQLVDFMRECDTWAFGSNEAVRRWLDSLIVALRVNAIHS